jgi:hypothetical protein
MKNQPLCVCMCMSDTLQHISDCPALQPGLGALASSRDTTFGTIVTFTCPVGQEFATGRTRITTECMLGGNWSVTYIPPCQGKNYKCPENFSASSN